MGRPKMIVSKSELADILHLSRGRISQLCKREDFPLRPDGKINRVTAERWYRDVGLGQSTKRGPKPKTPESSNVVRAAHLPEASADPTDDPLVVEFGKLCHQQGRAQLAHHICSCVRTLLSELFGQMSFGRIRDQFKLRVLVIALLDYLIVGWCEEVLEMGREHGFIKQLPGIDWPGLFGERGEEARKLCEALRKHWASDEKESAATSGEGENTQ